jgi:uncharacterized protein YeaO (DUF488 family)
MALYTRCILDSPLPEDGVRISVMSRHTLNDGVTPDARITEGSYDFWRPMLAPPPRLIGSYYRDNFLWRDFKAEYLQHLRKQDVSMYVQELAAEALGQDITLLCVEQKGEPCHRVLLAGECLRYEPLLVVTHR